MTCKVPHRNVLVAVAQCLVGFNSVPVATIFTPDMTSGRGGYMTPYNIGR